MHLSFTAKADYQIFQVSTAVTMLMMFIWVRASYATVSENHTVSIYRAEVQALKMETAQFSKTLVSTGHSI